MGTKVAHKLFSLYLPPSIYNKIKRMAEKDYDSMTVYILKILVKHIDENK